MITLVLTFVACLGAEPDHCRTVEVPWDGSLMQCMIFGGHELARWSSENPQYTIPRGWKCDSSRES